MGAREKLLDPLAGVLGAAAGAGAFFLIPGVALALPAALGIGAIVYGAKVAASSLTSSDDKTEPLQISTPQPKRGSPAEVWMGRAEKAMRQMNQLVAECDQPIVQGQLENVALQAADSLVVVRQLAGQVAIIDEAIDKVAVGDADRQRARLEVSDPSEHDAWDPDREQALDALSEQAAGQERLTQTRRGLLGRMEATVLALEGLNAHIVEVIAASSTAMTVGTAGEDQLADLNDELAGLRSGLEESRRYTTNILGSDRIE